MDSMFWYRDPGYSGSHCGWQDQYKEAERSIQSKKVTEF